VAEIERLARAVAAGRGAATEVLCAYEGCELTLVPSAAPAAARVSDATARLGGSRILIVDDDPELRLLARRALDKDGHSIREAADGAEGLERVADWAPDLVVLDLVMPEMDGLEVLRRLRAEPATKRLPVLVLTAHGDDARALVDVFTTTQTRRPMPQLAAPFPGSRRGLARAAARRDRRRARPDAHRGGRLTAGAACRSRAPPAPRARARGRRARGRAQALRRSRAPRSRSPSRGASRRWSTRARSAWPSPGRAAARGATPRSTPRPIAWPTRCSRAGRWRDARSCS
jgi:CheY-like chemotaxis protein